MAKSAKLELQWLRKVAQTIDPKGFIYQSAYDGDYFCEMRAGDVELWSRGASAAAAVHSFAEGLRALFAVEQ